MAGNDIGGVWRTVGGRRIFIKDGEDLSTAMKKSGKFNKGKEILKKRLEEDKSITLPLSKEEENKWGKDLSYTDEKGIYHINDTARNEIDKMYNDMPYKELEETYNSLERTNGKIDDSSYEARAVIAEYNKRKEQAKQFHETTKSLLKEMNNNSNSSDDDSFTMVKGDRTVTVQKDDSGKWVDSDGNRYMGYLSKEDVKSYFKGCWEESNSEPKRRDEYESKVYGSDVRKADAEIKRKNDEALKSSDKYVKAEAQKNTAEQIINDGEFYSISVHKYPNGRTALTSDNGDQVTLAITDNTYEKIQKKINDLANKRSNNAWNKAFEEYKKKHPNSKMTLSDFKKNY